MRVEYTAMSIQIAQPVVASVAKTLTTGAVIPPAAGTVPTADGAGAAVWSTPGGGGASTVSLASWTAPAASSVINLVNGTGLPVDTVCDVQSETAPELTVDPVTGVMSFDNPTPRKYLFMFTAQVVPSLLGTTVITYVSVNGAATFPTGAGRAYVSWDTGAAGLVPMGMNALMDIPAGPATAQFAVMQSGAPAAQTIRFRNLSCVAVEQLAAPVPV